MALIPSRWIRQMLAVFLGLNSKGLYRSWGKEKQSHCLGFTFSTKREIRHFHIVVLLWLQRNVQKSVMHVQSCCFANVKQLLFCRPRWRRCRRCLNSLLLVNNSQHCWMLPGRIKVIRPGCYMLRPFAHIVACCCVLLGGVVAQSLKPVKLLATCKRT